MQKIPFVCDSQRAVSGNELFCVNQQSEKELGSLQGRAA